MTDQRYTQTTPVSKATPVSNTADFARVVTSGVPPSNQQIASVIDHTQTLLETRKTTQTTPEGQKIIGDTQRVLESAKMMVTERNRNEQLQEMIYHAKEGTKEVGQGGHVSNLMQDVKGRLAMTPDSRYQARQKLNSARNLIMLLVRSPEFRDAMQELAAVMQQIIRVVPQKLKQRKGLTGQLPQSTQPTSGLTGQLPATQGVPLELNTRVMIERPGEMPQTITTTSYLPGGVPVTGATMPMTGMPMTGTGMPMTGMPMTGTGMPMTGTGTGTTRELRARIRNALRILSGNPQYRQGVHNIFRVAKQLRELVGPMQYQAKGSVSGVTSNEHLQAALNQANLLLAEFSGGRNLNVLWENLRSLITLIMKDQALRAYFKEIRAYVYETLDNPAVLDDDLRLKQLLQRGRVFWQEVQMHDYTMKVLSESRELLNAIRNDPVATRFGNDVQVLMRDLFMDASGKPTIKPEALNALREILTGVFMDELRYIPVPRIQGANQDMEFIIDNVGLSLFQLLPEDIQIKEKARGHFHPTNIGTAAPNTRGNKMYFRVKITKLATRIDNIHYWVRRFKAPRIEDTGVASVELPYGMSVKLDLSARFDNTVNRYFKVENAVCRIPKLKIRVQGSRYNWLLTMFRPIINRMVRRRAEQGVQDAILRAVAIIEQRMATWIESMPIRQQRPGLFQKLIPIEKLVPLPPHETRTATGTTAPVMASAAPGTTVYPAHP